MILAAVGTEVIGWGRRCRRTNSAEGTHINVTFDLKLFHQKNPPGHMLQTLKLFITKVCLRRDILIQSMFYVFNVYAESFYFVKREQTQSWFPVGFGSSCLDIYCCFEVVLIGGYRKLMKKCCWIYAVAFAKYAG